MEGWFISVPYTSVEVETVLRDGSKVNDSEHGTMVRPCIGIIRGRFSKIVESGPDELSHGPWIVISEGKINIRDIRPCAGIEVIAGTLVVRVNGSETLYCREFVNAA